MKPHDITYAITQHYIADFEADAAIKKLVGGYHRSRNIAALASCACHFDPAYHSVDVLRFLMQVEAFFKKNSIFSNKEVCFEAAKASFIAAEEQCMKTNLRLDYFYTKRRLINADLSSKLSRMERYIRNVLGPFERFLNDLPSLVKVTSGATSRSSRRKSLPQLKMRLKLHATSGAKQYLRALYRFYGFEPPRIVETKTNRNELVPKNFKTDRAIACEPEGNLPLQLAFDTYAKRQLRRFGIDLSDQSANQDAAIAGSLGASYATVDFKGASETVSYNAVAWFFPYDWYCFLTRIRSSSYRGAFGEGKYAKFSSMGNGSTFCIETLLFAAACYAVGAKDFLVYGDDVIIEQKYFDSYHTLTRFLGFTINVDKTHTTGFFRESCGVNVYKGHDVTPFYIRNIDKRKSLESHLINGLARIALPGGKLEKHILHLMHEWKLPLVPFNESTTSGVFIHPDVARNLGLLKTKTWIHRYKAYVPLNTKRSFSDIRGYYLWFLRRNGQVSLRRPWSIFGEPEDILSDLQTSSAPIFGHTYVRKWVGWFPPSGGIPVHLYWWTEQVKATLTRVS